jgi:phage shock protein C
MDAINHHSGVLTRSPNGLFGGVCEGLARRYDMPVGLIRLAWLASVLFFGTGVLLYLVLWWIVPRSDELPVEPVIWERDELGRPSAPLARTEVDRMFLGVCGGLARRWQIDPSLVRLGALSLAVVSLGTSVLAYLIAALVMPTQSEANKNKHLNL